MMEFLSLEKRTRLHAEEISQAVQQVVDSGWYLLGPRLTAFEKEYADYIGTDYCIGVGNGLDAITLIYRAYIEMGRMKPGDEVIVPANTYIASILAISENGLVPVPVEPDIRTLQMNPSLIEQHISPRTRSILMVHLYGRCAWDEKVDDICSKYGLLLVEDNAQAHGCRCGKGKTGALGNAAAHSFYPTKNLGALGDAGAVTTDDSELAELVKSMRNYGSARKYVFDYKGRNSRMDEIQAAVLSVRLKYLDQENLLRREIAHFYGKHISNNLVSLPALTPPESNVWHIFPIMCEERDKLQQFLLEKGIETQIHYPIPPHKQRCYSEWANLQLPVTEKIHNTILSLPIGPELSVQQVASVTEAISLFKI